MRLTMDLPEPYWRGLEAEAVQHGMKIGTWAKHLLLAHVDAVHKAEQADPSVHVVGQGASPSTGPIPVVVVAPPTVTPEEWEALKFWAAEHPEVDFTGISGRSAKMAHAIEHGFRKPGD